MNFQELFALFMGAERSRCERNINDYSIIHGIITSLKLLSHNFKISPSSSSKIFREIHF